MSAFRIAAAATALGLLVTGTANAALQNGYSDASNNTSVFISVVERDAANAVLRNLVIDTGARTLQTFGGTPWSTTAAQEAAILNFLATATGSVRFNVGGGLNDQSFSTDLNGFLTTGTAAGPGSADYAALGSGVGSVDTHIGNANLGTFNAAGVLAANAATDPGWHSNTWGNDVGGAIQPSNEILFGLNSQLVGWKTAPGTFEIVRTALGPITSNLATGDITFGNVPVPAAIWLLGSALAALGALKRRALAA